MNVTEAPPRESIHVKANAEGFDFFHLSSTSPLETMLTRLQALRAGIPEEYRASAKVYICGDLSYGDCHYSVTYLRPETDAEYAARVARVKHAEERTRAYRRKQYEELHKEFGEDSSAKTKP